MLWRQLKPVLLQVLQRTYCKNWNKKKRHYPLHLHKKNKRIPFSREHIIYWLELFRFGDTESEAFREKIVNTFINNIVVNEDTLIIAYNILNKERTVALDDIMQGVRMHDSEMDLTYHKKNP